MRVALISPNQDAYTETFIQAHRNIEGQVFFYFGRRLPNQLEGFGYIDKSYGRMKRLLLRGWFEIFFKDFKYSEFILKNSFKKNKIDVVLAEYGTTGAAILNVCKKGKIPLVTIFHGADASANFIVESHTRKYKELFIYSRKIIAVSELIKTKLIQIGCDEEKILLTPCAPDNAFLKINPAFSESRSFVAIGRFVNKKAPYYTILAIKKVAEKFPDVKLYFGGDGELMGVCRDLIRYFNLENNVFLLGRITPEVYRQLLSKVTGFIQHSITSENGDMEGTPVAILEASAAGLPVVATRHGGIIDVVIENQTGFLVEEHDVDGMASNIARLIENPALVKILGENGRKNIIKNYTMERHLGIIQSSLK